ncbi:MAG: ROK family protein [Trueperaceae bacterium]
MISFDIGGSAIKSGLIQSDGSVDGDLARRTIDSTAGAQEILAELTEAIEAAHGRAGESTVIGVTVAIPGPFDYRRAISRMNGLGKFEALYGLELDSLLRRRLPQLSSLPWRWVNDAAAFALGELHYGAARGMERAVFLTLGTGCGSAFAVDGALVSEGEGVPENGYVYPLPYRGAVVDEWLSQRGLWRLWREVAGSGRIEDEIDGAELADLARSGDERAAETYRRFGEALAAALAPVFAGFRAQRVVLGGQISRSADLFVPAARQALVQNAEVSPTPDLVTAMRLDAAALQGAASQLLVEGKPGTNS